jgi:gliding motility-associated-like protein
MKKIIISIINFGFFVLIMLCHLSGFAQMPTNGLVGCYPFSGTANDYSGHGNNGTVYNASLTIDRFNRNNNAYSFNGSGSYISLSPVNSFLLGNFTYSVWVKVSSYPSSNSSSCIISIGSNSGEQTLSLYNNYGNNKGFGFSSSSGFGPPATWHYGSLPSLNTWYHIAVTRSNTEIRFYINGIFAGNTNFNNSQASYGSIGQKRAIIGARYDHNFNYYFEGVVDDIHIYNRVLSASEISLLYNGGSNAVTINANPGTTICTSDTVTFTAAVSYIVNPIYQWQVNGIAVGSNNPTYSTSNLANGSIVRCLVFPQSTDCEVPVYSNALTMAVSSSLPLSVSITVSPSNQICKGDQVVFTAVGVNGGSSSSYQWKINDINVGTNQTTLTVDTLSDGANVYCILSSTNTCLTNNPATSNTIQMSVTEILPLSIVITASPSNTICTGNIVTFYATGLNGGNNATYQWKVNNINIGNNQQSISIDTLSDGAIISCVYSSASSCVTNNPVTSNPIIMIVKEVLPLDFQIIAFPSTSICLGTKLKLIAEIIGLPANGVSCQWMINGINVGTTSDTLNVDTLTTTAIASCLYSTTDECYTNNPVTKQINITVNPSPVIDAGISYDIGVSEGITLNTIYSGGLLPYYFNWTPDVTLTDPHSSSPIANPTETTEYFVEITDANNCKCKDSVLVNVYDFNTSFFVPNIFSPNNDQQNDVLYVRGKGIQNLQFFIYDRWGKQVFSTTSQENGWDGTCDGKKLNPATFIYYLKVKTFDGKVIEKKGNVTLVN